MENLNRHHLAGLRAVEATGRLGSLAKAAEELGVTSGAVSQHIRKVEAQLGRSVFERTSRGLRPTLAGARLLDSLTRGFQEIARGVVSAEARSSAVLTVTVALVLAAKWLVPRLGRFYVGHPGVRLRIDASIHIVDFDASDIDVGVRVGAGPWPNTRAEKLADLTLFPVCSLSLAEQIRNLDDLRDVPIIRDHGSSARWPDWLAAQGRADLRLGAGPIFSDASLCLEAAIAGQGVAMAWPTLAVDALKSGRIHAPFPTPVPTGQSYWLVSSAARGPSANIRAFGRWLREEMAADRVI